MKKITFDIKTILIIVLLSLTLIFGYKWYFGGDKESKDKVEILKKKVKELEKQEKEIDSKIKTWEAKFDKLDENDKKAKEDQLQIEKILIKYIEQTNKDKVELDAMKKRMSDTRKKIEEFKKNPSNRTGDDLMSSIKSKTE